ncbi:transglutaminase family protein [Rhodoferax sp.]|uniref:transglutaminase-like domain-containing protein n=1 Tax=Rhodoferax sp. TaxID=50421 RepID=UPI002731A922|nr:transglutaminase-like domain-containing protein [Rhodoferax sp.]MDP1943026.1 transglutaminase-like domain-containing protein [Rhodoferax sp.]MDP3751910.1 transglutaminase-like domain-containing protein [Polaromonas sp.]
MTLHFPNDQPQEWLRPTRLLDLDDPKLRIQAMRITQLATTDVQKAVCVHDFIKAMPFGCVAGFDHVTAASVLRAGRGDCHTKGTLLVAMLRSVGVPARLRFVSLPSTFLKGIIDAPHSTTTHAVGEVYLDGGWVQTDTYVADSLLETRAADLLVQQGSLLGYGVHVRGQHFWDGRHAAHAQYHDSDPTSMPVHDWGVAHDPEHFYSHKEHADLALGWLSRAKWMLAAALVNRRVEQVRTQSTPLAGQAV